LVGIVLYLFGVPSTFLTVLISSGIALAVASDLVFGFNFFLRLPFKVGDKIEIYNTGIVGRVMEINIAQSKIVIDDRKDIIISNRKLLENILIIHKPPYFDEEAQGHK
jgi:small-conductance mechanosensitive channel